MLLAALAVTLAVALASVATYVLGARAAARLGRRRPALAERARGHRTGRRATAPRSGGSTIEQQRRNFLLLLPSSPLGEQAGYAQVVSSAGRIQPPPGQTPLLAAGRAWSRSPRAMPSRSSTTPSCPAPTCASTWPVRRRPGAAGGALARAPPTRRCGAWPRCSRSSAWPGVGLAALLGGARRPQRAARPCGGSCAAPSYVAATQDLARRVDAVGDDELAGLARSFNAMLEALAESRRAQRQLIADASHELRTPLATVQANVELLVARRRAAAVRARAAARGPAVAAARADRAGRRPRRARARAPAGQRARGDRAGGAGRGLRRARAQPRRRACGSRARCDRRWCAGTARGSSARSPTCSTTRASGAPPAPPSR